MKRSFIGMPKLPRLYRVDGIWYMNSGTNLRYNMKAWDHVEKLRELDRKPLRHERV